MNRRSDNIDLGDVEREIGGGFPLLRFSPDIERRFESDVRDDRCKRMIRLNYIGIVIYHFFLFSDYGVVRDVFHLDLFVHFVIMTPVMLVVNFGLARRPPVWLREGLEATAIVILAVTILAVVSASRMSDRDLVNFTQALVILFAIIMQRMRFWYVIVVCLIIQILFSLGLLALDTLSSDRTLMFNSVFLGIALFSLLGSYHLESESRMGYLLRLRDHLRNQQLEVASLRDALTGIGNRRALDSALARLPAGAGQASGRSTAFLLLDVDHFKQFNDTNGHQEGDTCLRRVASLIEGSLRGSDQVVYRFGGEEFLVLLDDTSLAVALNVAERIRSNVENAQIIHDPKTQSLVTISVGVASGCTSHDATPDSLIAAADGALYAAKRQGRNRVVAAQDHRLDAPLLAVA